MRPQPRRREIMGLVVEYPSPISAFAQLLVLLIIAGLSIYLLITRRRRFARAAQALREFTAKARITSDRVYLGESVVFERGYLGYYRLGAPPRTRVHVEWYGRGGRSRGDQVSLRDLCSEPPTVVKYDSFVINALAPAIRVLSEPYRDVVVYCLDTVDFHLERGLEAYYAEGFAKGHLKVGDGKLRARVEWVHYMWGVDKEPVKAVLELCYAETPLYRRLECKTILEASTPGAHEHVASYPSLKKAMIGHLISIGFEGLEEVLAKFPYIYTFRGVVKLRVSRGLKNLVETSTPLK